MNCRTCGDPVDPARVELGYDYCMKDECQARGLEPILMARVGVNKAADQFVRADEVTSPAPRVRRPAPVDDQEPAARTAPARAHRPTPARRSPNALQRLQRAESRLDAALAASYDRFARGVTTAREMKIERNKVIQAFNHLVRAENIRYRSFMRKEFPIDG